MSLQTRKTFLAGLAANPTANGGEDMGPGPTISTEVTEFLNQAKVSGRTVLQNAAPKTINAKYKYMSIGDGGVGAVDKDARFTRPVGEFFCKLFRTVRDVTGHDLNKSDLWHGHLIKLITNQGCIVFHAKEYPNDIPRNSESETQGNFSSESQAYRYRNVIWKQSDGRIYKIDAGDYRLSQQRVITHSPLFDMVIDDYANELGGEPLIRAARTLPQDEMGAQLLDLYYLVDESFWTWKSSQIVMMPRS